MSLIILYLTIILLLPTNAAVYYLDQSYTGTSDGSLEKPFKSLNDAFTTLGAGVFELVLLGDQVSVTLPISVPAKSDFTLRPDKIPDGKSYFPLEFEPGANLTIYDATLTLQDIQIVELDKNQAYEESTFYLFGGQLVFNRVLISDINYPDWGYTLILTTGNKETGDTQLTIINSVFQDLVNVQLALLSTQLILLNTTFSNIQEIDGPLLFVYDNVIPELDTTISDITIQNSSFEYLKDSTPTNFLSFYSCTIDVNIKNMVVKDTSMTNGCPLIEYISDFENSTSPTSFRVTNVVFENLVEKPQMLTETQSTGNGLIFDIFGTTNLLLTNVTVSDVRFQYASMVAYNPNTDNFQPKKILLPSATIENLAVKNSSNANLLFSILDTVKLDNIELENNFLASMDIKFAQFALLNVTHGIVQNLKSTNVSGPIVRLYQVLNQELYNCTFDGTTTSQKLATNFQNIISISRTNDSDDSDPYPVENMTTIFDNVNINGFTDINPLNISQESNDTYAIIIRSEMGKVYMQNSKWSNLMMGGFLSTAMEYMEVDNLVVEGDPNISFEATPWHRIFQFVNIGQFILKNSLFMNTKNLNLFNLFNIPRDELFDIITLTQLTFDNLTVMSNQNDASNPNGRYSSLFCISSPLKPVEMTLTNSNFKDNVISTGTLLTDESYQVNVTLSNNVFENNFARQYGAVFTARDMQDETSQIQITNNIFKNNSCLQKGGVFAFVSTKHAITATDNTYTDNSAGVSGGVGYALKSKLFYTESNGIYSGNSAKSFGGSWYFSVSRGEGVVTPIDFTNTKFEKSTANQKGGAIYIVTGSLSLTSCTFDGNKAVVAGGDIYLVALSTLQISGVQFTNSNAAQGPLLYAETIFNETIVIEDCQISNIPAAKANTALIQTNAGSFKVSNTAFTNISCSLFNLEGTAIELTDVSLTDINCANSGSFCVLRGTFINLTISNSQISNVVANSDLVLLNSHSKQVIVDSVAISNVRPPEETVPVDQLFALRVFLAEDITVRDSTFENLFEFSTISAERSNLVVMSTMFSNSREGENADEISQTAQFLVLKTSNATVENCTFSENSAINDQINGGAILINGDGGDYSIQNSLFEMNDASNGGAISVEGTIDNFAVETVTFRNNTAIENGGAIYFNPEVITGSASIKDSVFEDNEAPQGGSIYQGNQNISIEGSTFNGNEGDDSS